MRGGNSVSTQFYPWSLVREPTSRSAAHRSALVQVFIAGYGAPRSNTGVLEQLLATRHDIAAMLGASSYAHYQARIAMSNGSIYTCKLVSLDRVI